MADVRTYSGQRFALDIDGNNAGWVYSVEGGQGISEVVTEKTGGQLLLHKHVAQVKYEDISLSCGLGMSKSLYQWIKKTLDYQFDRRNGAVVACDFNNQERWRMDFYNALVSEIGFPALDAGSKDPGKLSLKFAPEWTKMIASKDKLTQRDHPTDDRKGKLWMVQNFRLDIDGLNQATKAAVKVEALVIKQKVTEYHAGERNFSTKEPVGIELPNLVITVPEAHAEKFYKWHQDFVIRGNSSQDNEKNGTLEYLNANLKETLFTITMNNIGLYKIVPEKLDASSDGIRKVKIEMYVENMQFEYGSNSTMA